MSANDHARILGIIFLIFGGLGILAVIAILFFLIGMGGIAAFNVGGGESIPVIIVFLIFAAVAIITGLFIIPQIIAGWNLFKGNGKSKIWVLLSAVINVLNFPIGTAIGVYAFWFAFSEEGKQYFKQ
jgi:hypothetical protein